MTQRSGTEQRKTYRVLCIDGGGMRGIYTAAYLDELSRRFAAHRELGDTGLDLGRGFDLLVGTSTGAIVAIALAVGIPPATILRLYQEQGVNIFPVKLPDGMNWELVKQLKSRSAHLKCGDEALSSALAEVFGAMTIGELYAARNIALAIPAVEMARHHAWIFKTKHLPNSVGRDDDYQLRDVCLATSAAPIYRSLAAIDNPGAEGHQVFADGGLFANTPVLIALIDALQMTQPGQRIEIFGLGNCKRPEGEFIGKQDVHRGLLDWQFGGRAASLALDAQEDVSWHMAQLLAKHVDRQVDLVRFPQGVVAADLVKYLDLDETSPEAAEALVMQARADVVETLTKCGDANSETGKRLKALLMDIPPFAGNASPAQENEQ